MNILEAAREYYSSGSGDDKYAEYRTDAWLEKSGFYAGMSCAQARVAELEETIKRLKKSLFNSVAKINELNTDILGLKAQIEMQALYKTFKEKR